MNEENINQNASQELQDTQTIQMNQQTQNNTVHQEQANTSTADNQNTSYQNTNYQNTGYQNNNYQNTNGNVPPNSSGPYVRTVYVERPRKPFPWKAVLKYCAVFIVAGLCGFGGGMLAYHIDAENEETTVQQFEFDGNSMPQMPEFNNGNSGSNSYSGNSATQNTNEAALGIQVKETDDGVVIAGFSSDSNAETAGLKINDIIVAIDGNKYDTYNDIVTYIGEKSVGDVVSVTVNRDGEEKTIDVELVAHTSNSSLPSSDNSSVY